MRTRAAIERMDRQRGEWWLCRRDTDPRGKWTISCDPGPQWDWRVRVGFSYERAVRRLLVAEDQERLNTKTAERVKQICLNVDKMRLKRT